MATTEERASRLEGRYEPIATKADAQGMRSNLRGSAIVLVLLVVLTITVVWLEG